MEKRILSKNKFIKNQQKKKKKKKKSEKTLKSARFTPYRSYKRHCAATKTVVLQDSCAKTRVFPLDGLHLLCGN